MQTQSGAAKFFDGFAEAFDSLYDQKRNPFMRWVDRRFRSDMFIRFALTFEVLNELKGRTVLDVGCGSGPYIIEALNRGASRVTGVDPAPGMLALAGQRLDSAGYAQRCSLVESSFPGTILQPHDYAIVMGVMDYVADAQQFLTALRPLVRIAAAVSFPSKHWFRTPFRAFRYKLRACPVYFYDANRIGRLCSTAGFSTVEIKKIPGPGMDYHVCLRP